MTKSIKFPRITMTRQLLGKSWTGESSKSIHNAEKSQTTFKKSSNYRFLSHKQYFTLLRDSSGGEWSVSDEDYTHK